MENTDHDAIYVDDDGQSYRLNKLGLFVGFLSGLPNLIIPIGIAVFSTRASSFGGWLIIAIIFGISFISIFFQWLAWRRFTYIIGEEDIRIESGILNRNARSIPYERIQDVSIEQKLVPRLFGLGVVKFETGSGEGEDGKLAYVTYDEGERLRLLIRDRKEGVIPASTERPSDAMNETPGGVVSYVRESEDPILFAMDEKRIFTFGLFEFSLVIFAVLFGVAQQFEAVLPFNMWDIGRWIGVVENSGIDIDTISMSARIIGGLSALFSLIALGIVTGMIRTFLREYNFRLDRTSVGFRRRRGLTTLTDVVMPAHRVQAAIIQTGFLRKRWGWHALKFVSLAQDNKKEDSHVVAPFAKRSEINPIMAQASITIENDALEFQRLDKRWWIDQWVMILICAATISIIPVYFVGKLILFAIPIILMAAFALFGFLDWRHQYYAHDDDQIYVKSGWFSPRITILPKVKIQSVEISQGPISKYRGLAKMKLGIAGSNLQIIALPLDIANALRKEMIEEIVKVDFSVVNRG